MFNQISSLCNFLSGHPLLTLHTEEDNKVHIVSAKWECHGKATETQHIMTINMYSSDGLSNSQRKIKDTIKELNIWYKNRYGPELKFKFT